MAFQRERSEPVTDMGCICLRSKAMYVHGVLGDTGHPDDLANQNCWCLLTQHVVGPDGQMVDRRQCIPGRDCFRESM